MKAFADYEEHDALSLAALIRKRATHPEELVQAAIERIEQSNGAVNAVVHRLYDEAIASIRRGLPEGPFTGVPFLFKDLGARIAGQRITMGARFLKDYVAVHSSELGTRYMRTGIVPIGKTNTPELGLSPVTESSLFGPARNPWDTRRSAGGSSGGSAAAIASGMVPIASGGDGGGSLRIPASCCGIFAMKPTRGRNPSGPDHGTGWQGCVVEHILSRSVRDSAAMLDATSGPDIGAHHFPPPPDQSYLDCVAHDPPPLRVAFTTSPLFGETLDRDCRHAVEDAAHLLDSLGHTLIEDTPRIDRQPFISSFQLLIAAETCATISDLTQLTGRIPQRHDFENRTWAFDLLAKGTSAAAYARALRVLRRTSLTVGRFFENYDLFLSPTLGTPPPLIGTLGASKWEARKQQFLVALSSKKLAVHLSKNNDQAKRVWQFMSFTPLFNVTGNPAMSVPLYWNAENLPIGVQCAARFADETMLFRVAGQLERARPWFHRRPMP